MLAGLGSGKVVADTSTVRTETARQIAAMLNRRNADFLDCPVSGGVEGARNGTLAMMVGGDARVLEHVTDVLSSIASNITHMGPTGSGQATKAVNQIMAAGINQAVTEGLAFAQAMELPMDKVIKVVASGAAANWFLSHRGESMVKGSFDPGFKVNLHHKDLEICRDMASARTVTPLPLIEMTLVQYEQLMADGRGDEDISALFRIKRAQYGQQD
jgi:3-hydroxyisobutyrate dehydrogenase